MALRGIIKPAQMQRAVCLRSRSSRVSLVNQSCLTKNKRLSLARQICWTSQTHHSCQADCLTELVALRRTQTVFKFPILLPFRSRSSTHETSSSWRPVRWPPTSPIVKYCQASTMASHLLDSSAKTQRLVERVASARSVAKISVALS